MAEPREQVQFAFAGGANPTAAEHLLADGEVASATNIDFGAEQGAAAVRRGGVALWTVSTSTVKSLYRKYTSSIANSPYYAFCGTLVYRGRSGTFTAVSTSTGQNIGFTSYRQYAFIAPEVGSLSVKDDGTNVTDWIKQAPASAPITYGTLTCEGKMITNFAGTRAYTEGGEVAYSVGTLTATVDSATYRLHIEINADSTNCNITGTASNTIGDHGVHYLKLGFSDPSKVVKVIRDCSIGGTAFTDYWHAEITPDSSTIVQPDAAALLDGETGVDPETRAAALASARQSARTGRGLLPTAKGVLEPWAVHRTGYQYVGATYNNPSWANIGRVRVIVEATEPITVYLYNYNILGCQIHHLYDTDIGYTYYITWATLDTGGNVLGESAPSPASVPFKGQHFRGGPFTTSTPTGSHGITHEILYRQGGLLPTPYAVASANIGTGLPAEATDMAALVAGRRLEYPNIYSRANFPNNFACASEPFHERIFLSRANELYWSLPGIPDAFPLDSWTEVSHSGDEVHGLVVWPPALVVVNRDSVYELHGSEFEGTAADWVLQKTGAKRGCGSRRAVVKTPYGIPLFDNDGLSMYVPGQGVDVPIEWAMERLADAFRGTSVWDPAAQNGSRVPAINKGYLNNACAAFRDNKLYWGVPTGTNTLPSTLFVLDFPTQRTWWYTYPWTFTYLFFDHGDSVLLAGTSDGKIMQLEASGAKDTTTAGVYTPITWKIRTRAWTGPSEAVLENFSVHYRGGTSTVKGIYDGTTTRTLGTLTSLGKTWTTPTLGGTIANNAVFEFIGTQGTGTQNTIYGLTWDALIEPKRTTYFKTDYDIAGHDGEKKFEAELAYLQVVGTGTVLGTMYIDGTAVGTSTTTGPMTSMAPTITAYPAETYGKQAHTVYNGVAFKHWRTVRKATPDADRLATVEVGPITFPSDQTLRTWVTDLNPLGTATGTLYANGTAIMTASFVGTRRTTFQEALSLDAIRQPREAIDLRVVYRGGPVLKHYETKFETEPKPFEKNQWLIRYEKLGGASQLDLARFFALDIEPEGTATVTSYWDVDGTQVQVNTLTFTAREWQDRIPFAPGVRGFIFQQRLASQQDFKVWKSSLDAIHFGVKGLARVTIPGTPVSPGPRLAP